MIDSALKNKFEFILVEPSHPGNIGATARAIKNMGFQNLSLINPKGFPDDEAFFRAKGAKDILENVKIYNDLAKPLKDATLIFGTSARTRTIPWPTRTSSELHSILKKALTSKNAKICFLFGREISGLSNEELQMCDFQIKIPTDENFSSINLSHAVQIISYVLKMEIENIDSSLEITASERPNIWTTLRVASCFFAIDAAACKAYSAYCEKSVGTSIFFIMFFFKN